MTFKDYAAYYDLLYHDKDYEAEVEFIESFLGDKPRKILELGCGTGQYTKIFHNKGYDITGIDLSNKMIQIAKKKCDCKFIRGDIRSFSLESKFDLFIAMFAVLGYINKNQDIITALKNIKKHMAPNGLLVFDVWNGLAVMRHLPEVRYKEIADKNIRLIRIAVPHLKPLEHICEVDYQLFIFDENKKSYQKIKEKHSMRFFFPQEIKQLLENSGFEVLKITPFLEADKKLDENDWNMFVIARSRD